MPPSRALRLTFLAGSLEPDKDGVGDYSRRLAEACTHLGVSCQLIAMSDHHVTATSIATPAPDVEPDMEPDMEIVRLPASLSWRARLDAAERAIRRFAPDWVSVQFVPFSFQRWGIAAAFVRGLPRLIGPARRHVMLHEVWVGPNGSWRRRVMSEAQRRYVLRLCRAPGTLIHTSNPVYQHMLRTHGVSARLLPLFGSIPVAQADAMTWLGPLLTARGADVAADRAAWWLCVFFGVLHPEWPPEPLLSQLEAAAARAGKRVALISIGRPGSGQALWEACERAYGSRFAWVRLDEQSAQHISEVFNAADFGIATSPLALLGKSATATAMFEHGLPVIVNRDDVPGPPAQSEFGPEARDAIESPFSQLIIRLDSDFQQRLMQARRAAPDPRLAAVAHAFVRDLRGAAEPDAAPSRTPLSA